MSNRLRKFENRIRKLGAMGAWLCCVLLMGLGLSPTAIAQTTVTYIHTDALGSVVAESDVNGNVIKRNDYEPYGALVGGQVADGPGYTGHVSDSATGLSYMQQRYMDPQLGVFLSVDPVTAYEQPVGQFNRYRYANGNPYAFTDPDGREVVYQYLKGVSERRGRLHMMGVVMSPSAHSELQRLERSSEIYTVVMGNDLEPGYVTDTRTIKLNPTLGIKVSSTGEVQPPSVNSAHEISHAAEHDRLGTKDFTRAKLDIQKNGVDREENRASSFERQVGKELGEPTRQYYRDYEKGVKCSSDMSSGCGR
ncbi:RHS repeat domain-containing protein [Stenotrophomonas maltophilia]|uniref:RHS repeat domain-containing protein n=1 Tax=Stenotrophomonas maltophilia TaxID=40324 RepID=UPI0021ACA2D2|nr:RHS repeat-associated core domain-containing protein [Stenotrophomonas maltophilia]